MRTTWIVLVAGCGFQSQAAVPDANPSGDPGDAGELLDAAPDSGGTAVFDHATCPASYNVELPGPTRYRLIVNGHRAWEQSDACNADLPGASHLVIFETVAEAEAVVAFMEPNRGIARDSIWVGAVQRPTATQPDEQWLGFDGQPLIDVWHDNEPNDFFNNESDHQEQFALIERRRDGMIDISGSTNAGALCECDGKPLSQDVLATIDANRRPN